MDMTYKCKNLIATSIASILLLTQMASVAHAHPSGATDIADVPMAVKTRAKPNIMFVLDNSGSMDWQEMPDEVWYESTNNTNYSSRRAYRSSSFNRIYYNPNTTYTVPVNANGTPLTVPTWPTAYINGFNPSAGTRDMTTQFVHHEYGATATYANYCTYNTNPNAVLKVPADHAIVNNDANFTCQNVPTAQRQNFVIWHSFYRTRLLAMKSALSLSFINLNDAYRIGFFTINNNSGSTNTTGANFLNISDFNTTNKTTWFNTLFGITPSGGTPLQDALYRSGEYYKTGTLPGATGSVDPIQHSCQANYTLLSTDGYWNAAFTGIGNQDLTVPTLPEAVTNDPFSGTALTAGSQWPRPFYEGPTASSNSLADVAMHYWVTDLRSGMTNDVPTNTSDPAKWQHMVTFTLGMGVDGNLSFNSTTLTNLKNGTTNWPVPASGTRTTIDDLWHAAINGHGEYFSASDTTTLQNSLVNALNNIIGREAAAAAVTLSNPFLTSGNNHVYVSEYKPGSWTGELQAFNIDPSTGAINLNSSPWTTNSAQTQLNNKTWTTRYIATHNGTTGVAFTAAGIGTTLTNTLNTPPSATDGASVINFLRGDRSNEGNTYRIRSSVLGDIINAESVYVGAPRFNYSDNGYSAYKTAQASRTAVIYQPANDGLVHAFTAGTGGGDERWAYLPGRLFSQRLAAYPATSTLTNLSFKTGFNHLFYVDGTPVAGDIDFSYTSGNNLSNPPAPDWRSILVGGLGKGGRGYYALNVTNPSAGSDADVASKVMWEFPSNNTTHSTHAANVGFSFGKPIIVKTQAKGWVVLVTSGYNNGSTTGGDGSGYLYVLDAKTGDVIKAIRTCSGSSSGTCVGSAAQPSGFAHISAFVANGDVDVTVDYVYGGDLEGNVWRFDLTGNNANNWGVKRLAALVDASGNHQPITTVPELAELAGVGKRVVFVGTGQYLGDTDIPGATGASTHATQTQSIYALVDDLSSNPTITPLRSNLQQQSITLSGNTATVSGTTVNYTTKKGWFIDFPNAAAGTGNSPPSTIGQRVNVDPYLVRGQLNVVTNVPSGDPCKPGGSSWLFKLDYAFNQTVPGSQLTSTGNFIGNYLSSRVAPFVTDTGAAKGYTKPGTDAPPDIHDLGNPFSGGARKRVTWRELISQ